MEASSVGLGVDTSAMLSLDGNSAPVSDFRVSPMVVAMSLLM
jgi:hypothetical protein